MSHWAISYNKLAKKHVSRAATNDIEVIRDGLCQPKELIYGSLIETFSKYGDLILDIGSMQIVRSIITLSFFYDRKMVFM